MPSYIIPYTNLSKMIEEAHRRTAAGANLVVADEPTARIVGWKDLGTDEMHAIDMATLKTEMHRLDRLWSALDVAARAATPKIGLDPAWSQARLAFKEATDGGVLMGWPLIRPFLTSPLGRAVVFGVSFPGMVHD